MKHEIQTYTKLTLYIPNILIFKRMISMDKMRGEATITIIIKY